MRPTRRHLRNHRPAALLCAAAVLTIALLCLAVPALAAPAPLLGTIQRTVVCFGTVTGVDVQGHSFTATVQRSVGLVSVQPGTQVTFRCNDNTDFYDPRSGESRTLADLPVGQSVMVMSVASTVPPGAPLEMAAFKVWYQGSTVTRPRDPAPVSFSSWIDITEVIHLADPDQAIIKGRLITPLNGGAWGVRGDVRSFWSTGETVIRNAGDFTGREHHTVWDLEPGMSAMVNGSGAQGDDGQVKLNLRLVMFTQR